MDSMSQSQQRTLNLLGLNLYVDVHFVDDTGSSSLELRRLWDNGWILLARTDVLGTELLGCADPAKRQALEDLSSPYSEAMGPLVLGHSRLDHAVLGSEVDKDRLDSVYSILFPGVPDRSLATPNHLRDAMHVATAIRCGGHAFITSERRLLNKDATISTAFSGFRIWRPADALAEATSRVAARRGLHELEPHRGPLPT